MFFFGKFVVERENSFFSFTPERWILVLRIATANLSFFCRDWTAIFFDFWPQKLNKP